MTEDFCYVGERFADIQMLRYRLNGFEELSLRQKLYIYYLSEATLWGRDITFDQMCIDNLQVRKLLEIVYTFMKENHLDNGDEFLSLQTYLKRVWFSNGIHHHYGGEKFEPGFSKEFFLKVISQIDKKNSSLVKWNIVKNNLNRIITVIFEAKIHAKRTNKEDGVDLVMTSSCNFYQDVTQTEVEKYYTDKKALANRHSPSWGLNSRLIKKDGRLKEQTWKVGGLYGPALEKIVYWLKKASEVAEDDSQRDVISLLVDYYESGDLKVFDEYCIKWVGCHQGDVDFINGFIEVYDDPLGLKGTWEGLVEYKDHVASRRCRTISDNAQWFEDHSPVDSRFKKEKVKGVTANAICAAMLGGEEYPSTAIGINLPNSDWIRAEFGSKSITISNITDAYNRSAHGSGFKEEFVIDKETLSMIEKYGDACDDLHTDLHECLGHGSGRLLSGTDPDALKSYGNTIEEARADLFGLYYMADAKLVELGLLPDSEAYKAQYYTYLMNGLLTQITRIRPGQEIEEAHMRNRALIARWALKHSKGAVDLTTRNGKTYLRVNDYAALRPLFAELLVEIQRIKSEGDFEAARKMVEEYAVKIDPVLHQEILWRYEKLNLAPYKGFLNPRLFLVHSESGEIIDIKADYTETYDQQMLRYSRDYSVL